MSSSNPGLFDPESSPAAELRNDPKEHRYQRIFETAKDGILLLDAGSGETLDLNERIVELFGYPKKELIGAAAPDLPFLAAGGLGADILETLQHRETVRRDFDLVSKSGALASVELLCNVYDDNGRRLIQCNVRDVSERRRAEAALRESEERFRLLVHGVKDYAIFMLDPRGRVMSWNYGVERVLGYKESEIVGRDIAVIFTPEDRANGVPEAELGKAARFGQAEDERWHLRKDGSRFFASGVMTALAGERGLRGFAKLMRDVTERRRTEEALRQTQKLESIGVLAGGVAHDFNNLLTSILGNASLALDSLQSHPARDMIEEVIASSSKAADLTRQLLAYAGKGRFVAERLDLSKQISEILNLIHASVPKKVRLQLELAADLPPIEADPTQIQQIVMNLVINAAEAIGAKAGSIRVSTGTQQIIDAASFTGEGGNVEKGRYVYLEVSDDGAGMDERTKARIFDPFFTTKFTGRGLGLAAVSGIVRGHRAALTVESKPGAGATFRVLFPVADAARPRERKKPAAADLHGSGTILVVDDEAAVHRISKAALEHYGYSVLVAETGHQAIEILRQRAGEIALVLLDLVMPQMSGEEALPELRAIDPEVPIVITSGHSDLAAAPEVPPGVSAYLQKPYTATQLAREVKAAIKNRLAAR